AMQLLPQHREHKYLLLMLVLTFSTGIVDAVGYLGLERVFTANMTGNVVILVMAFLGSESLPILGPALARLVFFGGAAVGGCALRGQKKGWNVRQTILFLVVAGLLAVSLAPVLLTSSGSSWHNATTGLLGVAMGCQAAAARQ